MAEERFRAGLLDFGLNAGKVAGHYQLDSSLKTTDILLKEYDRVNYPTTAAAILNLKGALLYFNHKYEDAIVVFMEVQRIDGHNLNADANLQHIYKELGYWSEIQKVSPEQLASATNERANDDKLRALCQAEQAFAIMFDCHVSTNELEKFNRAKRLFEQSEMQCQSFNETEKMQFKFWYAELLQRLLIRIKSDDDRIVIWKKGVQLLNDITSAEVATNYPCLLATTYTCLGQFVYKAKAPEKKEFNTYLKSYDKGWLDEPGLIFQKALKIRECQSMEILTRYLLYLKGPQDPTEDHIKEMIRVVELIDNEHVDNSNWFSLSVASSVCLKVYKTLTKKVGPVTPSNEHRDDIDPILQLNTTSHDRLLTTPDKRSLETGTSYNDCTTPITKHKSPQIKDLLSPIELDSAPTSRCNTPVLPENSDLRNTDRPEKFIDKAIKYGEKAASLNPTNDIFTDLGVSYHKKAMIEKENGQDKSARKLFFKALCNFLHALRHLDGRKVNYIHKCHADCLWDMKEYRPALESYKRTLECGFKKVDEVYKRMLACYGKLLLKEGQGDDVTHINNLIHETCYWLKKRYDDNGADTKDIQYLIDECKEEKLDRDTEDTDKYDVYCVVADIISSMLEQESPKHKEQESHIDENQTIQSLLPNLQNNVDQSVAILCKVIKSHTTKLSEPLQKCIQYVIDPLHDDNMKDKDIVNDLSKSFIEARSCSHNKQDYKIVWIFDKMKEKCPNLSQNVALKIKEDCHNLAAVLLHLVGHDKDHELKQPDDKQDAHYDSEVLFLLKKEAKHAKHLQKCAESYEDKLLRLDLQPERSLSRKDIEPKVRNAKYDYDFYVIYSEHDTEWVLCQLLPTLEQKHGFKGCIDMRDSTPGRQKIDEMNKNIAKSYRTLAIVTEDFVKDALCKYQLHQMLLNIMKNTSQALIPVQTKKDIMDKTDLPCELHSIISVTTVDHSDWEKLVKALE